MGISIEYQRQHISNPQFNTVFNDVGQNTLQFFNKMDQYNADNNGMAPSTYTINYKSGNTKHNWYNANGLLKLNGYSSSDFFPARVTELQFESFECCLTITPDANATGAAGFIFGYDHTSNIALAILFSDKVLFDDNNNFIPLSERNTYCYVDDASAIFGYYVYIDYTNKKISRIIETNSPVDIFRDRTRHTENNSIVSGKIVVDFQEGYTTDPSYNDAVKTGIINSGIVAPNYKHYDQGYEGYKWISGNNRIQILCRKRPSITNCQCQFIPSSVSGHGTYEHDNFTISGNKYAIVVNDELRDYINDYNSTSGDADEMACAHALGGCIGYTDGTNAHDQLIPSVVNQGTLKYMFYDNGGQREADGSFPIGIVAENDQFGFNIYQFGGTATVKDGSPVITSVEYDEPQPEKQVITVTIADIPDMTTTQAATYPSNFKPAATGIPNDYNGTYIVEYKSVNDTHWTTSFISSPAGEYEYRVEIPSDDKYDFLIAFESSDNARGYYTLTDPIAPPEPEPIAPIEGDVVDVADGNSDFTIKSSTYVGNAEDGSTRMFLLHSNGEIENLPIVRTYEDGKIDLMIQAAVNEVQNIDAETLITFQCPYCVDKYIIHDNKIICFTSSADYPYDARNKLEDSLFKLCNVKQSDIAILTSEMPDNVCVRRRPIIDRRPIWNWDEMTSFQDAQLYDIFNGSTPLRGKKDYNPTNADNGGWYWDSDKNSFVCQPNSGFYYEILGPYEYDCYIHRVTLSSTNNDDDIIGFTIAYFKDENDVEHSIGVYACGGGLTMKVRDGNGGYVNKACAGVTVAVDYEQYAGSVIDVGDRTKALDGIEYVSGAGHGWSGQIPNGITILVSRVNERIRIWVAYNDSAAWADGRQPDIDQEPPTFDIDLSTYDDPAINCFVNRKCKYAYGAYSQAYSFYKGVVVASIDLDKIQYEETVIGYDIINNYNNTFMIDNDSPVNNIPSDIIEDGGVSLSKNGSVSTTNDPRRMILETPYRTVKNYYYPGSKICYETVKE